MPFCLFETTRITHTHTYIYTSSTAQGGGGSFKNRKPIGEVGCCESLMAERSHWWTERWLRSPLFLSLSLSVCLSVRPSVCLSISIYLSVCLSICLSIYLSFYLSIYLSISLSLYSSISLSLYLSISLSIYLFFWSIYLSIFLSIYLSVYLSIYQSIYLSMYLQACKRSYSSRLPQFLNLTTSNTQQFSETSSIFAFDNIKNEAILRDFLFFLSCQHQKRSSSARRPSKMEKWVQSWRPRTIAFCDFSSPSVWGSKMQPLSGNQRPDLLTALMNMSFVLRLPRKMHLCRSSSNVPRLPSFLEMPQNPHLFCPLLTRSTIPCACHAKRHLNV